MNGALVEVAMEISDCLTTGDWLATGDLGMSHLVNWVSLLNCLTGDL